MTDTGRGLFEHELRDVYDAENKLVNALQKMAKTRPTSNLLRLSRSTER